MGFDTVGGPSTQFLCLIWRALSHFWYFTLQKKPSYLKRTNVMASEVIDNGIHDSTRLPPHSPPSNSTTTSFCSATPIVAVSLVSYPVYRSLSFCHFRHSVSRCSTTSPPPPKALQQGHSFFYTLPVTPFSALLPAVPRPL